MPKKAKQDPKNVHTADCRIWTKTWGKCNCKRKGK